MRELSSDASNTPCVCSVEVDVELRLCADWVGEWGYQEKRLGHGRFACTINSFIPV